MTTTTPPRRVWDRHDEQPPHHPSYTEFWEKHERNPSAGEWERLVEILHGDPAVALTDTQLDWISARAVEDPVPPCRICGRALSVGKMGGGGPTEWYCSGYIDDPENPDHILRDPEWDPMNTSYGLSLHHVWSGHTQGNGGDPLVRRLVAEIRRLRAERVSG